MTPEQQHLRHQMAVHAEQERTARRAMQHEEIKMTSEEYLAARKAEMAAQDEAARAAEARAEKPAQARDALGQGAWGALASLKP